MQGDLNQPTNHTIHYPIAEKMKKRERDREKNVFLSPLKSDKSECSRQTKHYFFKCSTLKTPAPMSELKK
jgi:hypothetical protein